MRALGIAIVLTSGVAWAQAPDLGHRLPGSVGLDAGSQPDPGLCVVDRLVRFAAGEVNDRNGNPLPIKNLDIDAVANVTGVAMTFKLDELYLSASLSVPLARTSVSADQPQASVDRLGLGDIFVEPLHLGERFSHADGVVSYSFSAPTSETERKGIGRPQWSQLVSAGGTVFFDDRRGWRLSALVTYVHNQKKVGIDITRGDSLMIQGGLGGRAYGVLDIGIVGYAVRQLTDDHGAELPDVLRGARERVFGIGPEVDLAIPALRSRLTARFEWDLDGATRPVGTILVLGLSVVAWR